MSTEQNDDRPIDILDTTIVQAPFGPLQYLDSVTSDSGKTDNTIRLVIFEGL